MPPPICYSTDSITKQWVNKVSATVVIQAVAQLQSGNMNGGSGPDSSITPPGWGTGDCPTHHNRGHLIGNNLGGPGNNSYNLVTLTAGTNHPFMYEYEDAVRRCVLANPDSTFTYTVACDYNEYTFSEGFPIPGAGGNPFCLFPAPAKLTLSLQQGTTAITLGQLAQYLPKPPDDLGKSAAYTHLIVPNGGYKLYASQRHIQNACWAVMTDPARNTVRDAAIAYARHLGHVT